MAGVGGNNGVGERGQRLSGARRAGKEMRADVTGERDGGRDWGVMG